MECDHCGQEISLLSVKDSKYCSFLSEGKQKNFHINCFYTWYRTEFLPRQEAKRARR